MLEVLLRPVLENGSYNKCPSILKLDFLDRYLFHMNNIYRHYLTKDFQIQRKNNSFHKYKEKKREWKRNRLLRKNCKQSPKSNIYKK